ncbi:hypothetical protein [Rhodanobacter koreensis]
MFDVIDFLETVGQDAQWRHADSDALTVALTGAQIDQELRIAILARDGQGLQALLGQAPFCCYINPGKEDEGEGDKDDKGKDDKDGKDKVKKKPSKAPKE